MIATKSQPSQVRRAAIELLGCHDASVIRYVASERCRDVDQLTGRPVDINSGPWYALATVDYPGDPFAVLCRRPDVGGVGAVHRTAGGIIEEISLTTTPARWHNAGVKALPWLKRQGSRKCQTLS